MKQAVQNIVMGCFLLLSLFFVSACDNDVPEGKNSKPVEKENAGQPVPSTAAQRPVESDKNSPPEIQKIVMSPVPALPGTIISVEAVAEDPDGDNVLFRHDWLRNGDPVFGEHMPELDTSGFDKGDRIVVIVTPFDSQVEGEPLKSSALVLDNRPPEFLSSPPTGLEEGRYVYQVQAGDPDGDPLTYALEEAPEGMSIDEKSGLLEWQAEPGQYQVKVVVSDGERKAFQTLGLTISRQQVQ